MNRKPYPMYKPSGIDWLGDVPDHWEVKRSDGVISTAKEQLGPESFKDQEVFHYSIPAVQEIGTGQIEEGDTIASSKQVVRDQVLLISKLNPRKATICLAEDQDILTVASTEFVALKAEQCSLLYLRYLALSETFRQLLDSKVQSVTRSHQRADPVAIYRFWTAWPPLPEQRAITDFLDARTEKLDALIEKRRSLIEKLEEKRGALISDCVTGKAQIQMKKDKKGRPSYSCIHPSSLPKKPSGIDWLGKVPEHWEVKRLSYLASFRSGEGITSDEIEDNGEYPVFGGNGFRGFCTNFTHNGNFILIGRQGALCGNINYATEKFWASEHAVVVSPVSTYVTRWLGELLRAMNLNQYSVSAAQPGLSVDAIKALRVPVPPLPEQQLIADYLDAETAKIDRMVEKIEAAIERLQEYRTALITAAVTGKVDLTDGKR